MKKIKRRQMKTLQAWMRKTMDLGKKTSIISKKMLKERLPLVTLFLKKEFKICKGESKEQLEALELTTITICRG